MSDRGQPQSGGEPEPEPERRGEAQPRALGGALRSAWVGYQRRLDVAMADAGFPDRRYPDGRVLRLCARTGKVTASVIGRELGMTRQGAGKIITDLRDRGYVVLEPSPTDGREKVVTLTSLARDYLSAQRTAARRIEQELRDLLGAEAFDGLSALLDALGGRDGQPRLGDYLRYAARLDDEAEPT
jgi:DNA-binding MarR family transcriptional regulator